MKYLALCLVSLVLVTALARGAAYIMNRPVKLHSGYALVPLPEGENIQLDDSVQVLLTDRAGNLAPTWMIVQVIAGDSMLLRLVR